MKAQRRQDQTYKASGVAWSLVSVEENGRNGLRDRIAEEDEGRSDGPLRVSADITGDQSMYLTRCCSEH